MRSKRLLILGSVFLLATAPITRADAPATDPAMQPATQPATQPVAIHGHGGPAPHAGKKEAKISPDAAKLLAKVKDAYAHLNTLELAGTYSVDFVIGDQSVQKSAEFTSLYAAPDKFRHEMKDDVIMGSTGEQAYIFLPAANRYLQQKLTLLPDDLSHDITAPAGLQGFIQNKPAATGPLTVTTQPSVRRLALKDLPGPMTPVLETQNTSMQLALSPDAGKELIQGATEVNTLPAEKLDGKEYPTLQIKAPNAEVTVLIDPDSNLIRRVDENVKADLEKRGAEDVKKALVRTDYTTSKTDVTPAANAFAWSAPADARPAAVGDVNDGNQPAATALEGKPAPDIMAKTLDGKDFRLSDHRGNVVVLDFWATWCGPCVGELPSLDKLYQAKKGEGLEMFLVNQNEDPAKVKKFVTDHALTPPIVLDNDSVKAGDTYKADAIPETIVIGKDGTIRKVIVGAGPESAKELEQAIDDAMKADK